MGEKRMSLFYNSDSIVMACIANIKKSTRPYILAYLENKKTKIAQN